MTWGRPLWMLIILKVIILFAVLRAFFFEPVLAGKTEEQKIEHVGMELKDKMKSRCTLHFGHSRYRRFCARYP